MSGESILQDFKNSLPHERCGENTTVCENQNTNIFMRNIQRMRYIKLGFINTDLIPLHILCIHEHYGIQIVFKINDFSCERDYTCMYDP